MITNLLPDASPEVYFDVRFANAIEQVLDELEFEVRNITLHETHVFEFDFYGLLRFLKVPVYLHWINLRLNGMHHPSEYQSEVPVIKLLTPDSIARFRRRFNATKKIHP